MRYWKRVDTSGMATTVESYSHNLDIEGAIEVDKDEFTTLFALITSSLPNAIPQQVRDLVPEIDLLQIDIQAIKERLGILL